jgi:uncharacterized protein
MDLPEIISPEFIAYLQKTYQLSWHGIHGWAHWVRVCENGLRLARLNGANETVVALFAFTHDMARQSDGSDYDHGKRAAQRIRTELQGTYIHLSDLELKQMEEAVSLHTRGFQHVF